jgi:hypothetical protein
MGNEEKIAKLAKINRLHAELAASFVAKLRSIQDGDGTLLDHSMILYGSGLSDGNNHTHIDLPIVLAGGANGAFKSGRHVVYPKQTPLANLYVSMLGAIGASGKSVGDATGPLDRLTAV